VQKLNACPFCGGEARRVDFDDNELRDDGNFGGSLIECTRCMATTAVHFDRKENLVSSWNERVMFKQSAETLNIVGQALMQAQRDKVLTQADRDEVYARIRVAFGLDDWHPGMIEKSTI
jgi:hypothetical protein